MNDPTKKTIKPILKRCFRWFYNHKTGLGALFLLSIPMMAWGQVPDTFNVDVGSFFEEGGLSKSINLLLTLASITLIPFFLISTTSFLRTVIVLSMIRSALQTQQAPPSTVIVSLSMFLTIFVMTPTVSQINEVAFRPYQEGKISQKVAFERGVKPFRDFMIKFINQKDMTLFLEFSKIQYTQDYDKVPIFVLIPAFIISELKRAFQIGFLLFIPFIVIDLIISNVLLSLGMFMLSPAMVSLPFKILLFVLTDGWNLIIRGLLISFK